MKDQDQKAALEYQYKNPEAQPADAFQAGRELERNRARSVVEALKELISVYDLIRDNSGTNHVFQGMVYGFFEGDGSITRSREALKAYEEGE